MDETTVGIAELRTHLSEYLWRAKAGERIVVCEEGKPVAELVQVEERARGLPLRAAVRPWASLAGMGPVRTERPIDVVDLLREGRDQR